MQKLILSLLLITSSIISTSVYAKEERSAQEKYAASPVPFSLPLTDDKNLGDIIASMADENAVSSYPKELTSVLKKLRSGKKTVSTIELRALMPYVLKRIAPQLLEDKDLEGMDLNELITRAQRIKDGCNQSINKDVTKPVTKNNVDLGPVIALLCKIQQEIEECCHFLCKKIENIDINIDINIIIDTITECCADLSQQIEECCDDTRREIRECCDDLSDQISQIGFSEETIIETITQCCEDLSNQIQEVRDIVGDCCGDLTEDLDDLSSQVDECCTDLLETITECCDNLSEQLEIVSRNVEECCEDLESKIDECCEDISDQLNECCEDILETLTDCCQTINDKLDAGFACDPIGVSQEDFNNPLDTFTITEPGNYCLTEDINSTVMIAASRVTLDLNGRRVNGKVNASNVSDIVIKKGYIAGMILNNINNAIIEKTTIKVAPNDVGIKFMGTSKDNDINRVKIFPSGPDTGTKGISLEGNVTKTRIRASYIAGVEKGIDVLDTSKQNYIRNNIISVKSAVPADARGIRLGADTSRNLVRRNIISDENAVPAASDAIEDLQADLTIANVSLQNVAYNVNPDAPYFLHSGEGSQGGMVDLTVPASPTDRGLQILPFQFTPTMAGDCCLPGSRSFENIWTAATLIP